MLQFLKAHDLTGRHAPQGLDELAGDLYRSIQAVRNVCRERKIFPDFHLDSVADLENRPLYEILERWYGIHPGVFLDPKMRQREVRHVLWPIGAADCWA